MPWQDRSQLHTFITIHSSWNKGEHGETDCVQMQIVTGDSKPKSQPARRMPFAARQEVAR